MTALEGAFDAGRWQARWIWFEAPRLAFRGSAPVPTSELVDRDVRTGLLRRRLSLETVPESVPARFTADSRYVLFANGVEVMRGPIRDHPSRLHYDCVDLAPFLRAGENAIAVLVRFYGAANAWWAPAVPAGQLGAGAFVFEALLAPETVLVSETSGSSRVPRGRSSSAAMPG